MNRGNRYYTLMIIPERTSQVMRWLVPGWLVKTAAIAGVFLGAVAVIMLLDYWYVMSQISENKELRIENRKLKQQVQVFESRIGTVEDTMERIRTFSMRLKVITNLEDRDKLIESLNQNLPEANANIDVRYAQSAQPQNTLPNSAKNPENIRLARDQASWDLRFASLSQQASLLEQQLQNQYELLADRKAFLNALPTRKPAVGYFTSGFGIRRSPYGGREKMHEGLDIANYPGTAIRATAEGTVAFAGAKAGYGQTVILDHGYGLETWYAHNRRIHVKQGQRVRRGELISQLGNSGRSTGPHLHYEVRINGTPVDPLSYILEN
ncbi:MAG: peptidoglycan DD-metalloendopeptidase family protein [Oligoflexia bacterium]|jgi:murein DD-endopeptidase MepM/ murein hydrolase activator NlpD